MLNKAQMLNKIKEHYGFQTDSEFANHLGVQPQVLSNWKSRKTFDAELIYSKCKQLNPAWLLCQEGSMLNKKRAALEVHEEKTPYFLKKSIENLEKQLVRLQDTYQVIEESKDFFHKVIQETERQLQHQKKLLDKS